MTKRSESVVQELAGQAYWQEDDARVLVEALAESGESLAAFSRCHGFDPRRLGRWRSVLARRAHDSLRFHPVELTGAAEPSGAVSSHIEIELASGRRIHIGHGFDAEDLRLVVAVLEDVSAC